LYIHKNKGGYPLFNEEKIMKRIINEKIAGLTHKYTKAKIVLSNGTEVTLNIRYPTTDNMNELLAPENLEITAAYVNYADYIKDIRPETVEEWKRSPEVQQAVKDAKTEETGWRKELENDNWTMEDETRASEWESEVHGGDLGTFRASPNYP